VAIILFTKMYGKKILNLLLLEQVIVILVCFKADEETYNWFKSFEVAKENVILAHKNLFDHVDKKMQKLKLGLKSYRYFDQAKELADKLGIALNESVLNESSSMALSIYSPTNLADLLTDEVEQTREEKIAIAKQLLQAQQNSLN
jgi:hypothetical protein